MSSMSQPKRRGTLAFPIRNLRRYLHLISQQITVGASLIIKHPFTPPPCPTWPLHLILFIAMVKTATAMKEHIAEDVPDIRRALDTFFYYLPKLPQMRIVPFKVPIPTHGRGLPSMLEPLEQLETGHRIVPGQWVADRAVWDNVMAMPLASSAKKSKDPYAAREGEKIIYFTHGGGYFICSSDTHREMLWRISRATGRRIFAVDYRLAPEHPYPAAVQDALHAFLHLTDPNGLGFSPENVTVSGDSAGGGLAIAMMMYQRDHGLPMPSKAILLSPWLDLTMTCESWASDSLDYLPARFNMDHSFNPILFYCSGRDKIKTLAKHPYLSPLWGNLEGLPPLLIQCGEAERLLDECILFTFKAGGWFGSYDKLPFQPESIGRTQDRKKVELELYPHMVHVFQIIPFLPGTELALQRMLEFMQRHESTKDEKMRMQGLTYNANISVPVSTQIVMNETLGMMEDSEEDTLTKLALCPLDKLPLLLQLHEDDARLEAFEGINDIVPCEA
ncbi:hypothetical protein BX616_008518 [Lobosporangium transversale]|nr:hypothetical protein BX616_008518 [Lobosporangium transversale]